MPHVLNVCIHFHGGISFREIQCHQILFNLFYYLIKIGNRTITLIQFPSTSALIYSIVVLMRPSGSSHIPISSGKYVIRDFHLIKTTHQQLFVNLICHSIIICNTFTLTYIAECSPDWNRGTPIKAWVMAQSGATIIVTHTGLENQYA